ncbi:hypothetical protein K523DRAFT_422393 [Schizophyllum commune Tattone D]|nr:hypothetical protein K523DRAFT_422393 [Schizophyllum commune Tattone D]
MVSRLATARARLLPRRALSNLRERAMRRVTLGDAVRGMRTPRGIMNRDVGGSAQRQWPGDEDQGPREEREQV